MGLLVTTMPKFMQSKKPVTLVLLMLAIFASFRPARADYFLKEEAERYLLFSNNWTIKEQHSQKSDEQISKETSHILGGFGPLRLGDTTLEYSVEITYKGAKHSISVNMFRLADRIDSNTICGGNYRLVMSRYLQDLEKVQPRPEALIMLGAESKGGPLYVEGIWPFDENKAWDNAIQRGSHVMNLSAEKVRALGSASNYKKAVIEKSDNEWQKLQARSVNARGVSSDN